jgi:hypothetical protein
MQLQRFLLSATMLGALVLPSLSIAQAQPAPPEWAVIISATIKPEFRQEFEAVQKEITAAYKKAGVPSRIVVQTMVGDMNEYTSISPISKLGDMDGPQPLQRALGEAGYQKIVKRISAYVLTQQRVVALAQNDISIQTPGDAGEYAQVGFLKLFPGKGPEYTAYMKSDYLPMLRKANVKNFWMSSVVFGSESNQRVSVRPLHKIGELDAGPLTTQALGAEGARQLAVKQAGIVQSIRTSIVHIRADLSLMPTQPPAKPSE